MKRIKSVLHILIALIILFLPFSAIFINTTYDLLMLSIPTATPIHAPIEVVLSVSGCKYLAEGAFSLDDNRPGCPSTGHPRMLPEAWGVEIRYQPFERGAMLWSSRTSCCNPPYVYVLYADGSYQSYPLSDEDLKARNGFSIEEEPSNGRFTPASGLRKIWQEELGVRESLGWATAEAINGSGRFQPFSEGAMIWLEQRQEVYTLESGRYHVVNRPTFALATAPPPANVASLILGQWADSDPLSALPAFEFLTNGAILFDNCRGNYELLEAGKISVSADGCASPELPSGIYEYTINETLTLSQRYKFAIYGYSETNWRQEDNNYEIELSPGGVRIMRETTDCYGLIEAVVFSSVGIDWSGCRSGEKRIASANYKFTYVGQELFLTREFERLAGP